MWGELSVSEAATGFSGSAVGGRFGYVVAAGGDLDGDGRADALVSQPVGTGEEPGTLYGLIGPDLASDEGWTSQSVTDGLGYDAAGIGDVNSDGYGDVLVTLAVSGTERVAVLLGPPSGWEATGGDFPLIYHSYCAVAGGQDASEDGIPDLLIGSPYYVTTDTPGGAVLLYAGAESGGNLTNLAILAGETTGDVAGSAVAMGQLDADGVADFVIGAPGESSVGLGAGAAFVVPGPVGGTIGLDDVLSGKWTGETAADLAGQEVASGFDMNKDGLDDLIVGAPGYDEVAVGGGAAYVLLGPATGTGGLEAGQAQVLGADEWDYVGFSVSGAGDVDGDGFGDVLVGAIGDDTGGEDAGAAFLFYGPLTGALTLAEAGATLVGAAPGDHAGWSVAGPGDIDRDGFDDVLVGAPDVDGEEEDDVGAAYLFLGGRP